MTDYTPDTNHDLRRDLALANRILENESVLDAFGHVSVRYLDHPGHFLIATALAPALVTPADILECDAAGEPVGTASASLYAERVIHSEIYRVRPDIEAICHHHSNSILPFCIAGTPLFPVFQLGGVIGEDAPLWDSREEFGDTNLLLTRPEEGASLARALGPHFVVLMAHHGATVAGRSLRECVFRSVHCCANARALLEARLLGHAEPLTPGERTLVADLKPGPIDRCWNYWLERLRRTGSCNFLRQ